MPASREAVSLLAVDRCVSELRRGRMVCVRGSNGEAALVQAAEAVTDEALQQLADTAQSIPTLAITARRGLVLNLTDKDTSAIILGCPKGWRAETILDLADPLSGFNLEKGDCGALEVDNAETYGCESAAIGLAKVARLLPAAIVSTISDPDADDLDVWAIRHSLLVVDAGDVFQYEHTQARTLKAVSEARVPLMDAHQTRIIAFRPFDGGLEHLAIVIGEPSDQEDKPVLAPVTSVEDEYKYSAFGVKGVGEIALISTPSAIIHAIHNATGIRFNEIPLNREKICFAIKEKNNGN